MMKLLPDILGYCVAAGPRAGRSLAAVSSTGAAESRRTLGLRKNRGR